MDTTPKTTKEKLRHQFDAGENSFLLILRCELRWDWNAFYELTSLMYDVAFDSQAESCFEKWVAEGFWYCDTWIKEWSSHPNFPAPEVGQHEKAIALLHDLAWFYFMQDDPYRDNTLEVNSRREV